MRSKDLRPEIRRKRVNQDMTAAMREMAQTIHTTLRLANKRDLLARHAIGRMVRTVTQQPARYAWEGLWHLADFTGFPGGRASLAEMRSFADEFTKTFIIEQANTPMANGAFVSYGHFRELMRVKDVKKQRRFLERARTNGLTVARLRREIIAEQRRDRENSARAEAEGE